MPDHPTEDQAAATSAPDAILRFRRSERHLHWAIAVPFMLCYVTAAILVAVYNPDPSRPFRAVVSWIHRFSAVCLVVLPLVAVLAHRRDFRAHLHNTKRAWTWTAADVIWLLLVGPATVSSRVTLPEQGKFNAGEKTNFVLLMSPYPVYIVTGLFMWFANVPFFSWLVHVYTAAFVATPLMLGHIYMAVANPDTRAGLSGMFSGFVDRQWARHHYRLWYEETFGTAAGPGPETAGGHAVDSAASHAPRLNEGETAAVDGEAGVTPPVVVDVPRRGQRNAGRPVRLPCVVPRLIDAGE